MDAELRSMVMAFRVAELQALLGFAGKNKSGRKNELQARCLEMVKGKSPPVVMKIRDLYRSIQVSNYSQPYSAQNANAYGGYGGVTTASGLARSAGYSDGKYGQDNSFGKSIGYQRVTGIDGQCRAIPICPDIKLKELPFYDTQAILIKPTSLINQAQSPKQETQHSFCLTPSQAAEISSSREVVVSEGSSGVPISKVQYTVQVQLRFCALDESTDEQDDLFPPNLVVKVNGRLVQLPQPIPSNRPGVEPKRPSKPLNITNSVKCCPHSNNTVHVQWVTDNTRNYCMTVFMVKRLTADELFQRLKSKRIQPADFTRGRIKEITTSEEEDLCAPTSISVSVACPLGKNRMTYPCRATTCKHLQCFDANLFLLMNEKKPTFICPVCNKHLKFDDLSIDGYFMDVIRNLSFDAGNEIELFPDGHWEPVVKVKAEPNDGAPPSKRMKTDTSLNQTIDLEDDICIVEDVKPSMATTLSTVASQNISKSSEPECIDLLDSSDDEEETPTNNRISEQPTIECANEEDTHVVPEQKNASDDEEEIGIRPRRRKPRVNYCIDESSSDSSEKGVSHGKSKSSRRKERESSPACIELSDSSRSSSSPEPESTNRRAFASVSSQSSSRSSSTSSYKNIRSGSGTSTLYSSTATTTPPVANPTGTGHDKIGNNSSDHGSAQSEATNNSYSSTTIQATHPPQPSFSFAPEARTSSPNVFSYNPSVPTSTPSASSLFYPSASQTQIPLPGYPPFDPRSSWQTDLNSFINPQLNHGQMDLPNPFDYNYFNNPSFHLGYDPRNGGGGVGGGGGFGGWM